MKIYELSDLKFDILIFKSKVSSIITGFWYWVTNKNELTYLKRLDTCNGCEFSRKYTCGECGCFKQLKLRLKDSNCPLDKW